MQKNRTLSCPSLTKTDVSLDLVPERHKRLPTAPGCPGGRTVQDGKMQRKNSLRPRHACVSVCVLCRHPKCMCVSFVPVKLTLKTLKNLSLSVYSSFYICLLMLVLYMFANASCTKIPIELGHGCVFMLCFIMGCALFPPWVCQVLMSANGKELLQFPLYYISVVGRRCLASRLYSMISQLELPTGLGNGWWF